MTTQAVQVKLELGHRASLRRKPTTEGHTHDWTVFVRGPEGSNIQHFVEKVVFQLHESFPKPRRVVKDPPYQVSESGYGSFQLPIEIYFKNREDPRKICFDYDLFLHLEGSPPVNHTRCEKLTFQGPNEDFRRKLIMAGGVGVLTPGNSPAPQPAVPPPDSGPDTPESSRTFNDLFGAPIKAESKKEKHSKSRTNGSGGSVSLSQSYPSMGSGSSSKDQARLSSSSGQVGEKSHKEKPKRPSDFSHSGSGKKSGELNFSGMGKSSPSLSKRPNESSPSVNSKNSPSVPGKPFPSMSSKRPSDSSPTVALKRLPELAPSPSESSYKKKKRESDSGSAHKSKHKEKERERGKSSHSSKDRSSSSSKHKSSKDKKPRDEEPKVKQEKKESSEQKSKSTPTALPKSSVPTAAVIASKPISETKTKAALRPFEDELSTGEQSEFDPFEDDDDDDAEPVSLVPPSLSKTIQPPTSRTGKQASNRLLSQLESEDSLDDDDILSPMSRTSPPALFQQSQRSASPHISSHLGAASKDKRESLEQSKKSSSSATKQDKSKSSSTRKPKDKRSKEHRRQPGSQDKESSRDSRRELERREKEKETAEESKQDSEKENRGESTERGIGQDPNLINHDRDLAPNGEDLAVLLELQQRLMTMTDRQLLQRVVSVIEETGMYKIGDATFDFDLCSLDRNTVGRIKTCLEAMSTQC